MNEHAFSTDNPETVAAYRDTNRDIDTTMNKAVADAEKIGKNKGLMVTRSGFNGPRIVGLAELDPNDPPAGWQYTKRAGHLVPGRGKAGAEAQKWLDESKPADIRSVLERHGLPRWAKSSHESASFAFNTPAIFEHDGTLWVLYRGHIDGTCTWTPRKLSEYHAAREQFEAANKQKVDA